MDKPAKGRLGESGNAGGRFAEGSAAGGMHAEDRFAGNRPADRFVEDCVNESRLGIVSITAGVHWLD